MRCRYRPRSVIQFAGPPRQTLDCAKPCRHLLYPARDFVRHVRAMHWDTSHSRILHQVIGSGLRSVNDFAVHIHDVVRWSERFSYLSMARPTLFQSFISKTVKIPITQWCAENGISYRTVLRARQGTHTPTIGTLHQMAHAFGCSVQEIADCFPPLRKKLGLARKG